MPASLHAWWSGSTVPSAADMDELLGKIRRLRARFPADATKATAHDMPRLALIDGEIVQIATEASVDGAGKIDAAKWEAKPDTERRQLAARADQLFDELRSLTSAEQKIGWKYFIVFAALFFAVTAAYVASHRPQWDARNRARAAMTGHTELTLADVTPGKTETPADGPTPDTAMTPADGMTSDRITATVRDLKLLELEAGTQRARKPAEADRQGAIDAVIRAVDTLKRDVEGVDLSFSTLQLLGTVEAEARHGALLDSTDSVARLRPALLADLESLRSGFFWSDRIWRWFEIAWWAEIGVLVGILFYIAGLMSEGRFEPENRAMFLAEAAIAPVVVLVIFFLFTLTGITGISPTETSLAGQLGFAFLFGFAIRRTIGLLDTIKKKIFPDPAP